MTDKIRAEAERAFENFELDDLDERACFEVGARWMESQPRERKIVSIKPVDLTHDIEQLALFMNARDVAEHGTAKWDQLDHAGREEYQKDARLILSAILHLGWVKRSAVER